MSETKTVFPIPIDTISKLEFNARTGELQIYASTNHPIDGEIPWVLAFSSETTQKLALSLAQTHKFLDEQLEGKPVTNVLQ
ncbi:hypothetical protein MXE68_23925 [Escherichia coli]|nr:hypothetical protein [Escherichia coli]MEB5813530.1 hypothetical protein [Escherichia coli]MEB6547088.1 hypothetical protein [Escherichia coli]